MLPKTRIISTVSADMAEIFIVLIVVAVGMLPPAIPLASAWGRWHGRNTLGGIELCSRAYHPQCKSPQGFAALVSVTASVMVLPVFMALHSFGEAILVGICLIGLVLAAVGMLAALFAREGIRGATVLAGFICTCGWMLLIAGAAISSRPD